MTIKVETISTKIEHYNLHEGSIDSWTAVFDFSNFKLGVPNKLASTDQSYPSYTLKQCAVLCSPSKIEDCSLTISAYFTDREQQDSCIKTLLLLD